MTDKTSKIDIAATARSQAPTKTPGRPTGNPAPANVLSVGARNGGALPTKQQSAKPAGVVEAKAPAPKKFNERKAMKKIAAGKPVADVAGAALESAPAAIVTDPVVAVPMPATTPSLTTSPLRQLKDKTMATAPNTAEFTTKMDDAATDGQARMKAAYAKGTELAADVTAFHKGNFDALIESGKILAAGMQDLGRTVVEDSRTSAESVTADVKAMVAVKSPTELLQLQGEIARRNMDTLVARTSKNAELMMKLANDMFAPLATRASIAMERLSKAAA